MFQIISLNLILIWIGSRADTMNAIGWPSSIIGGEKTIQIRPHRNITTLEEPRTGAEVIMKTSLQITLTKIQIRSVGASTTVLYTGEGVKLF